MIRVSSAEFRRLWADQSMSTKALARQLGMTTSGLRARAALLGLPSKRLRTIADIAADPEFSAMWRALVDREQMGTHFGMCERSIYAAGALCGFKSERGFRFRMISLEDYRAGRRKRSVKGAPNSLTKRFMGDPAVVRMLEAGLSVSAIVTIWGPISLPYAHHLVARIRPAGADPVYRTLEQHLAHWRDLELHRRMRDAAKIEVAARRAIETRKVAA